MNIYWMGMETFQDAQGKPTSHVQAGPGVGLETVIRIEDLQVDIGNGSVRIGQDYIPVTLTEFRILCTLMMQPAAFIRRAALLKAVCENNTHATSRSLDVHISRLRTKMGPYGSWIRTVKGVGYRFAPIVSVETAGKPNDHANAVNL